MIYYGNNLRAADCILVANNGSLAYPMKVIPERYTLYLLLKFRVS
jgi:hypothetical protein